MRPYTIDEAIVYGDIMESSVVLMPSRSEGFGLVGLEAISVGVPVLVSKRSGLAELLGCHAKHLAQYCIVDVEDNEAVDSAVWQAALQNVLNDLEAAFDRAKELRELLAAKISWEQSVNAMIERLYAEPADMTRLLAQSASQ